MRFFVLGLPHTVTHPDYSACAFTSKVLKLCRMLKMRGHTVFHVGNEDAVVECDENIVVTTRNDLAQAYGDWDWRTQGFPPYDLNDSVYQTFNARAPLEIAKRAQRHDFLLCPFGAGHRAVAEQLPELIAVESGIGYPGGWFAKFRVFESYAILHAALGTSAVAMCDENKWYDVVIPNAYDVDEFEYRDIKDDYFLFLGRIGQGKGTHIATDLVKRVGGRLIVAGAGEIEESDHVKYVGVVGPEERKRLLAGAKATICASTYVEPFCGVQIESMLSGTPVISTDWGAFAEYNLHGVTGYRCRTMEQFEWAARSIYQIEPGNCRVWATKNFSLNIVAQRYDEYFWSVARVFDGQGWYHPKPERRNMAMQEMFYP